MTKFQRECFAICRDVGLRPRGLEHRGKHWAVVCEEGRLVCPSTPSDRRTLLNLRCAARKLASMG